jgi:hypothetical protein
MDPVRERVAVLVLRVSLGDGPGHAAQIQVSTVDRLPPHGEPPDPHRQSAPSVEEAIEIVRAWLDRIVTAP